MIVEIKAPSPGESITEVEIAAWLVEDGEYVEKNQEIGEIESDKATLPLIASMAGVINIKAVTGQSVKAGDIVCLIDTDAKRPARKKAAAKKTDQSSPPVAATDAPPAEAASLQSPAAGTPRITPVARKLMAEHGLSADDVSSSLQRIRSSDVHSVLAARTSRLQTTSDPVLPGERAETRTRMSQLRRKLSERLVAVRNETAMLTTFNEVDMSDIIRIRNTYQKLFQEKHGVKLGFMSFFTRAVVESLKLFPNVNSCIEGEDIVIPSYVDIGIAVQTDKGLTVPVIRNAESMSLAAIEKQILYLAEKARRNRLSLQEMSGGTFTITNGGVFGSMLSTPILNPPQSAILGMHNIIERPVARDGQVVIRPVMYVALSYDHRIIDGRESVSFLVRIKEFLEQPLSMLFEGTDPEKFLLEI
jgi:2-oxoglutarate dehydrogenase E2 component (dihydrolipoamide succinyltransferase)